MKTERTRDEKHLQGGGEEELILQYYNQEINETFVNQSRTRLLYVFFLIVNKLKGKNIHSQYSETDVRFVDNLKNVR